LGCEPNAAATQFADVDGDGKADAIVVNTNGITVRRSNGANAFLPNETWTSGAYDGTLGTYFADVTGDGKADAIVVNTNGINVRRSNGSQFLPNETWTTSAYYGNLGTYFADVDGDGKADAILLIRAVLPFAARTAPSSYRMRPGPRAHTTETWARTLPT
jgi:hypothetical protein